MKKTLHRIIKYIAKFVLAIRPISQGRIKARELFDLLQSEGIKFNVLVDNSYDTISKPDMKEFLEFSFAKTQKYAARKYDCDNFAAVLYGQASYLLKGFALGMVHVKTPRGAHALNLAVSKELGGYKLYYIEPQTNEIFSFNEGKRRGYEPYFVLI